MNTFTLLYFNSFSSISPSPLKLRQAYCTSLLIIRDPTEVVGLTKSITQPIHILKRPILGPLLVFMDGVRVGKFW